MFQTTISLPPVNINHENNEKDVEKVHWGIFLGTYSKNGGTDLLQVGTQEALFHMHFYIRPVTTIKSTEPFIFALVLSLYNWSYVKKILVLRNRKYCFCRSDQNE